MQATRARREVRWRKPCELPVRQQETEKTSSLKQKLVPRDTTPYEALWNIPFITPRLKIGYLGGGHETVLYAADSQFAVSRTNPPSRARRRRSASGSAAHHRSQAIALYGASTGGPEEDTGGTGSAGRPAARCRGWRRNSLQSQRHRQRNPLACRCVAQIGRIAVKVINHFGDEVLKVFGV